MNVKSVINKRIFFSLLLFLFFGALYAQNAGFKPQWFLGAKGGATFSMVNFSPTAGQGFTFGANGGFMARYLSHKNVGLQFEILYAEKGWKEAKSNYNRKLTYVSLPFVTHITFGNKIVRGIINLGPEISYLCIDKGIANAETTQYRPVKNKFDYGIVGGLGIELRSKKAGIYQLEGRYYFGIGNLYGARATDYFRMSSNQSISVNLAVLFGL